MSRTTIVKCDSCKKKIDDVNVPLKLTFFYWFAPQHRYIGSSAELCQKCGDKFQNFLLYGEKL